jgi:mRNA interferase HigB
VGYCLVFDIKSNNYRVIVEVNYAAKEIIIKNVLTHAEYGKEKWKGGCQ